MSSSHHIFGLSCGAEAETKRRRSFASKDNLSFLLLLLPLQVAQRIRPTTIDSGAAPEEDILGQSSETAAAAEAAAAAAERVGS